MFDLASIKDVPGCCCSCGRNTVCWEISVKLFEPICEVCYGTYLVLATRQVGKHFKKEGFLLLEEDPDGSSGPVTM